jgi:hypothetical protein
MSMLCRAVLRRNPHQHPLLYLKGVKYADLESVINFMYHGEVNVAQDDLNSFLAVAEELKVKGTGSFCKVFKVALRCCGSRMIFRIRILLLRVIQDPDPH